MTSIIEKRVSLHIRLAEHQQQNDALKTQNAQLQALANIGTVTHMIAHEMNNLLTPVGNYATLAMKSPDDKALVEKALQKTAQSCERATKIMESMLAMADGKMQEKKNARLIVLVEDIFTCLCRDFAKDGVTVNIQIPEDLRVWAVSVQIQQVLMNLILNARDAMLPRGGILDIKATENSDTVQIEVKDTGCGIKPDDLKNIFESFFTTKTDKSSASRCSGSGLGLAFCKKIIDAHGGRISVESKPAEGSRFTITLLKPQ
ncbi:MAG: sensor histidine kinase [Planctomycetota bacterium]